jgi:hypothetical protein
VDIIQGIFTARPACSVFNSNHAIAQTVFELASSLQDWCLENVCIVVEPSKSRGEDRFGFIELFACVERQPNPVISIIQLKNVTLGGLWRATANGSNEPADEEKERFRAQISGEKEADLLRRRFHHWDATEQTWSKSSQSIDDLKQSAVKQVRGFANVMRIGNGLLDNRIGCQIGSDTVMAFVVISVGSTRVIICRAASHVTQFSFRHNSQRTVSAD